MPLLSWTPSGPTVVARDFNADHPEWQPLADRLHGEGRAIIEWMQENNMSLASRPSVPTHDQGNTLDLVWSNTGALADVAPWIKTTSDHRTLAGDVPKINARASAVIRTLRPIRVHNEALEEFKNTMTEWSRVLSQQSPQSTQGVDELADTLTHRDTESRKAFKKAVALAKRNYWRRKFAEAESDADLYKLAQSAKGGQWIKTSPLRTANGFETDPERRAYLLRDMLLGRFKNENDITDEEAPENYPLMEYLPWDTEVTEQEARWAATACKDKAPGADGITTRLLRAAWPSIGHNARALNEGSLKNRHFPEIFKLAEVILVPKPSRDHRTAKGWRPIALISCLGKGLEILVAKRMAHTALERNVIPRQLFGALLNRFANDLVACVIHDIEHTLQMRQTAELVTLDVQGAYHAVLHERLLKRMRNMGLPEHILFGPGHF
ncbi:hypothetical protein K3495_g5927 [Podosphaera aphanis]|nr:hypothetical protein K3495_g5927 [Podosphaera aphanis]